MRILALKSRRLGDTILWTSALEALRAWSPTAQIDLAFPTSYTRLFEYDTRFQEKILLPSDNQAFGRGTRRILRTLRKKNYDLCLNFHASHSTAFLARFCGARKTIIHHHSRAGKNFFSQLRVVNLGKVMPAHERDLNVVRTLGWTGEAPAPRIIPAPHLKEKSKPILRSQGWREGQPLVLLHPGASRPAKEWGLEHFAELAKRLSRAGIYVGVVFENQNLVDKDAYFKKLLAAHAAFFVTPDLGDIIGLLSFAQGYVGSDSGIKHLAASLGVPTVTLFGPESIGEWHFYDTAKHRALQNRVGCRSEDPHDPAFAWCGEYRCPLASHACMNLFRVEDVLTEVLNLI